MSWSWVRAPSLKRRSSSWASLSSRVCGQTAQGVRCGSEHQCTRTNRWTLSSVHCCSRRNASDVYGARCPRWWYLSSGPTRTRCASKVLKHTCEIVRLRAGLGGLPAKDHGTRTDGRWCHHLNLVSNRGFNTQVCFSSGQTASSQCREHRGRSGTIDRFHHRQSPVSVYKEMWVCKYGVTSACNLSGCYKYVEGLGNTPCTLSL